MSASNFNGRTPRPPQGAAAVQQPTPLSRSEALLLANAPRAPYDPKPIQPPRSGTSATPSILGQHQRIGRTHSAAGATSGIRSQKKKGEEPIGLFYHGGGTNTTTSKMTGGSSGESITMQRLREGAESVLNTAAQQRSQVVQAAQNSSENDNSFPEIKKKLCRTIGPAMPGPTAPVVNLRRGERMSSEGTRDYAQSIAPTSGASSRLDDFISGNSNVKSTVQILLDEHTSEKDRVTSSFALQHTLLEPLLEGVKASILGAEAFIIDQSGRDGGGLYSTVTPQRGSLVVPYAWYGDVMELVNETLDRTCDREIRKQYHTSHNININPFTSTTNHTTTAAPQPPLSPAQAISTVEKEIFDASLKAASHNLRVATASAVIMRMLEQVQDVVPGMGTALKLFNDTILPEIYQGFEGHAKEHSFTLASLAHHIAFFAKTNPVGGVTPCLNVNSDTGSQGGPLDVKEIKWTPASTAAIPLPSSGMTLTTTELRFSFSLNNLLHTERTYLQKAMENWGFAIWRGNRAGSKKRDMVMSRLSEILHRGPISHTKRRVMACWKLYVTQRRTKKLIQTTCRAYEAFLLSSPNEGADDMLVHSLARRAMGKSIRESEAHRRRIQLESEGGDVTTMLPVNFDDEGAGYEGDVEDSDDDSMTSPFNSDGDNAIPTTTTSHVRKRSTTNTENTSQSTATPKKALSPSSKRSMKNKQPSSPLGGGDNILEGDGSGVIKKRPNNITLLNSLFGVMMRKIKQLDDVGGSLRQQSSHQVGTLRNFEHESHEIRKRNRRLEQQLLDAINEKLALQNLLQEKDIELLDLERRVNRLRSKTKLQMHQPWRAVGFKVLAELCGIVSGFPGTNDHLLMGVSSAPKGVPVGTHPTDNNTMANGLMSMSSRDLNAEYDRKERDANGGRMGIDGDAGHPAAGLDPAFLPTDEELAFGRLAPLVVLSTCGTARRVIQQQVGVYSNATSPRGYNSFGPRSHRVPANNMSFGGRSGTTNNNASFGGRSGTGGGEKVVDTHMPIVMPDPLVILRDWVNSCLDALHSLDGKGGGSGPQSRRATELGSEMADGLILSRLLFFLSLPRYRYQSAEEENLATNTPASEDDCEANRHRLLSQYRVRLSPPVPSYFDAFDDIKHGAPYQRAELLVAFASDLLDGRPKMEQLRDLRKAHLEQQMADAIEKEELDAAADKLGHDASGNPMDLKLSFGGNGGGNYNNNTSFTSTSTTNNDLSRINSSSPRPQGSSHSPTHASFRDRSMSPHQRPITSAHTSRASPAPVMVSTAEDALDVRDLLPPKLPSRATNAIDLYVRYRAGEAPAPHNKAPPRFGDGSPFPMPRQSTGAPGTMGGSARSKTSTAASTMPNVADWALQLLHDNAAGTLPNLRDSIDPQLLSTGCRLTTITLLSVLYLKYSHPFCHKTSQDAQEEQELLRSLMEEAVGSRVAVENAVGSRDASNIAKARAAQEERNRAELEQVERSLAAKTSSPNQQSSSLPTTTNTSFATAHHPVGANNDAPIHRVVTEGRGKTHQSIGALFNALQSFSTSDKSPWQVLFEQLRPMVSGCDATHLFLLKGNFWDPQAVDSCDTFEVFSRVVLALNESLRRHRWHILTTCLINTGGGVGGVGGGGSRAAFSGVLGSPATFLMERRNEALRRVALAAHNTPQVDPNADDDNDTYNYVADVGGDVMYESVILGESFGTTGERPPVSGGSQRAVSSNKCNGSPARAVMSPRPLSIGSGGPDTWQMVKVISTGQRSKNEHQKHQLPASLRQRTEVAIKSPFSSVSAASSIHLDPRAAASVLIHRGDVGLPSFKYIKGTNTDATTTSNAPDTDTCMKNRASSDPNQQRHSVRKKPLSSASPGAESVAATEEEATTQQGAVEPVGGTLSLNDYVSLSVSIQDVNLAICKDASSWVDLFMSRCAPKAKVSTPVLGEHLRQQGGGMKRNAVFEGVGGTSLSFGGSGSTCNYVWSLLSWRQFWREMGLSVAMVDEELLADVFYSATRRGRMGVEELVNHDLTNSKLHDILGDSQKLMSSISASIGVDNNVTNASTKRGTQQFTSSVWPPSAAQLTTTTSHITNQQQQQEIAINLLPTYNWSSYLSAGNGTLEVQQMLRELETGNYSKHNHSGMAGGVLEKSFGRNTNHSSDGVSPPPLLTSVSAATHLGVPTMFDSMVASSSSPPTTRQRATSLKGRQAPGMPTTRGRSTTITSTSFTSQAPPPIQPPTFANEGLLPRTEILPSGELVVVHPDYFGCRQDTAKILLSTSSQSSSVEGGCGGGISLDSYVTYRLACHSQQSELIHRETQELNFDEWLEAVVRLLAHIVPHTLCVEELITPESATGAGGPGSPGKASRTNDSSMLLSSSALLQQPPPLQTFATPTNRAATPLLPSSNPVSIGPTYLLPPTMRPFLQGIYPYATHIVGNPLYAPPPPSTTATISTNHSYQQQRDWGRVDALHDAIHNHINMPVGSAGRLWSVESTTSTPASPTDISVSGVGHSVDKPCGFTHRISLLSLGKVLEWFSRTKAKPQNVYIDHPLSPKLRLRALVSGGYVQEVLRHHGAALTAVFNHFGKYRGPRGNAALMLKVDSTDTISSDHGGGAQGSPSSVSSGTLQTKSTRRRGGDISSLLTNGGGGNVASSISTAAAAASSYLTSPLLVNCDLQPVATTLDLIDFLAFVRDCEGAMLSGSAASGQGEGGYLLATELFKTLAQEMPAHSGLYAVTTEAPPPASTKSPRKNIHQQRQAGAPANPSYSSINTTDKPHRSVASHAAADSMGKGTLLTIETFIVAIAALAATRYPNVLRPFHMRLHEFIVRFVEGPLQGKIPGLLSALRARRGHAAGAMAAAMEAAQNDEGDTGDA